MARLKVTNSSSTTNISFQNEPVDFLLNSQRVTVFNSSVLNNIGCTKPPPFHMAGLEIVGPKKSNLIVKEKSRYPRSANSIYDRYTSSKLHMQRIATLQLSSIILSILVVRSLEFP